MWCVKIIAVGKIRRKPLVELINDYMRFLRNKWQVEIIEIKSSQAVDSCAIIKDEEKRIVPFIKSIDLAIALDESGELIDSRRWANLLSESADLSRKVGIFIGGAFGLSDIIKKSCKKIISLSSMTLPHDICRLIAIEQIYRAYCLTHNHPYPK